MKKTLVIMITVSMLAGYSIAMAFTNGESFGGNTDIKIATGAQAGAYVEIAPDTNLNQNSNTFRIENLNSGNESNVYEQMQVQGTNGQAIAIQTTPSGSNLTPLREAFKYKNEFTLKELNDLIVNEKDSKIIPFTSKPTIEEGDIHPNQTIVILIDSSISASTPGDEIHKSATIPKAMEKGSFYGISEDKGSFSKGLALKMAKTALLNGANVLHITNEGGTEKLDANGWGFNTGMTGGSSGERSIAAVSGIGWFRSLADTTALPYIYGDGLLMSRASLKDFIEGINKKKKTEEAAKAKAEEENLEIAGLKRTLEISDLQILIINSKRTLETMKTQE